MSKPKDWATCEILAQDEGRLQRLIRVRLIELAFTQDSAVSIRAIELLQTQSSDAVEDDLSDFSTDDLLAAEKAIRGFLRQSSALQPKSDQH